jgi:ribosomal protein L9
MHGGCAVDRSIRVVLLQALEGRGGAGEEVEVRRGFARNYLIPKKIAVYSTELNRTKYIREAVVADLPLQVRAL